MTYEELIKLTNDGIEFWKPIKGYENCYKISNMGRIKSIERDVTRGNHTIHIKERIKKSFIGGDGYHYIMLCKNSKTKLTTVHRLLAETFIPNPQNKPEVDHINTNRQDFSLKNLRWVTHKENNNNEESLKNRRKSTYSAETVKKGMQTRKLLCSKNGAKTVYQYTKDGVFINQYYSMVEAKRNTGAGHICEVLDDNTQTSGGFLWTSVPVNNLKYKKREPITAKPVQLFDLIGNLKGEWPSLSEASRSTKININAIARNIKAINPTKYRFKYKEEDV